MSTGYEITRQLLDNKMPTIKEAYANGQVRDMMAHPSPLTSRTATSHIGVAGPENAAAYQQSYDQGFAKRRRPYRITFALDLFNGPAEREVSRQALDIMLECLFKIDMLYLRTHPNTPLIYESGVRYMEEPPGQEDWQDVPTTIALGIGDCLPLDTMLLREDNSLIPLSHICAGDRIQGDGGLTTVLESAFTGEKPVLSFGLNNQSILNATPAHRLFTPNHNEIRAEKIRVGDLIRSANGIPGIDNGVRVTSIEEKPATLCGDIKTDTGRFYLPESDTIVHNCEDLACWRAAELNVREGIAARPIFREQKRSNGSYLYHILTLYPPSHGSRIEDPSAKLGMR